MTTDPVAALVAAVTRNDVDAARSLLEDRALRARINEPLPGLSFGSTLLHAAVNASDRAMITLLLDAGADINIRSHWWAGGFGLLESASAELVPFLLDHGIVMTIHGSARLGRVEDVERLLDSDASLVRSRAGDGKTPLHYASTVEIARLLLDRGAEIDALDVDHESTAAQYLVRSHPDVARYLVQRGGHTDLLMAVALGEDTWIRAFLDADSASIAVTVTPEFFPMANSKAGGSIYIWVLGANTSPHALAHALGHTAAFELLMARSPDALKLATACEIGDAALCEALLREHSDIAAALTPGEQARLVAAAERGAAESVRLMLKAGWPVSARNHAGETALHWAAFHGNADIVRELLRHGPALDALDNRYQGTPLDWAGHGAKQSSKRPSADHAAVVELLGNQPSRE